MDQKITQLHQHHHHPETTSTQAGDTSAELKDPVCGMTVTAQSPHQYKHVNQNYYFCSVKCLGKFSAAPQKYMQSQPEDEAAAAATAGTIYTCPMHPEVRQDHPGSCPKCGMTLEPELPDLDDEESPELRDFARRFWWTLPLTVIVFVLAMAGRPLGWFEGDTQNWIELILTLAGCIVVRLAVL